MAYKSIIVGTDGSETAERAVITAAGLAAADDARLVVVTAYEESRSAAGDIAADRVPVDIRHVLTERVQAEELAERGRAAAREAGASSRSEEHTSELQSIMRNPYAVFFWKTK